MMRVAANDGRQAMERIAAEIARAVAPVAVADSRFGRDFTRFIPGFEGAEAAAERLFDAAEVRAARRVFITPDNAVEPVRRGLLAKGVDLVIPSYGLHRGFLLVEAAKLPAAAAPFAGWLDAVEHFGRALKLPELGALGAFDLIVTGAAAITAKGLRFGMGAEYLDIEWCILRSLGLAGDETAIAAVVHDLQVTHQPFPIGPSDVAADLIATPTILRRAPRGPRPSRLDWSIVPEGLAEVETLRAFRLLSDR